MSTYRLYLLDARGRITWGQWFEADTPEDALRFAKTRCQAGVPSVEVWQGGVCLYRFNCPEQEIGSSGRT